MLLPAQIKVSLDATLRGHRAAVYAIDRTPEGDEVFSGAGDGMIARWLPESSADGEAVARLDSHIFSLLYLSESGSLIAGDMQGNIHFLPANNPDDFRQTSLNSHAVYSMVRWQDDVFAGCGNGYIHRLSADSAEVLQSVQISGRHIRCLYIVNDLLYAGCSDNCIYLLDPFDLSATAKQTGHQGSVFSLAFNPYLNQLLSGSMDAQVRIWTPDLDPVAALEAHLFTVNAIAVHPEWPIFATASRDKNIRIWDASNYTLLKVLTHDRYDGHTHSVNKIFWSGSGGHLISCSDDRTLKVWDVRINL